MNYFSIDYTTIQNFMTHIKNVNEKKNDELLETIKTWGSTNSKLKENMKSYDWKELIKSYYKSKAETIPNNIVFYIPNKKITEYCLNHDIIDNEDLTQENIMLDLFMDDSDDEEDDEES
jgi:K+ transporter